MELEGFAVEELDEVESDFFDSFFVSFLALDEESDLGESDLGASDFDESDLGESDLAAVVEPLSPDERESLR